MTTTEITNGSQFFTATIIQPVIPAEVWLTGFLRDSPRLRREVETESHRAGYRWASVTAAAELLGVLSRRVSERGPWLWSLR